MIITVSEYQILMSDNETSTALIKMNIPIVEAAICEYCNNFFIDCRYNYFSSTTITVGNDNSINYTGIGSKSLIINDDIRVHGSLRNDGAYTINTVNENSLIIDDVNTLVEEDEGKGIFIFRVKYPKPLKMIAAKMIKYNLDQAQSSQNIKSEKIDDYSISYIENGNGYPNNILNQLNCYRKLYKDDFLMEV